MGGRGECRGGDEEGRVMKMFKVRMENTRGKVRVSCKKGSGKSMELGRGQRMDWDGRVSR